MRKKIVSSLLIGAAFFLSSCATIISGSKQHVVVSTKPSEARIYINGAEVGKAPFETLLKRNREYFLTIKLPGYKPYKTVLKRKFNAWTVGNVVFGGFIGLGVDLATGALYKLSPEVLLNEPGHMLYTEENHKLTLSIVLSPGVNSEKIGQMEK